MFEWIKKLSRGQSESHTTIERRQTRVVKKIIPSSQRDADPEAEADLEVQRAPVSLHASSHAPAAHTSPVVTLTSTAKATAPAPEPAAPRPQPAPISFATPSPVIAPFPMDASEPEEEIQVPRVTLSPARKSVVRLFATEDEPPAPASAPAAEPVPAPRIAMESPLAIRKPGIKLDMQSAPAAAHKEIVLCVSDFLDRIPAHFVDESAAQGSQEVRFNAADLYSDMTKGRATIPLSIIFEAIPSLFKRRLSSEEDVEILLPLPKIVGQMGDLLTRQDQEQPEAFEELETPFLKAAQRDGEIHKVSGAVAAPLPLQSQPIPIQPSREVIQLPPQTAPPPSAEAPTFRPKPPALKISGPPGTPPAIAVSQPSVRPAVGPKVTNRRVTVRVRPLIQAMPIEHRDALLSSIPEDSQVDLPLDAIEGQLPSGRVFLPLATFSAALNPAIRSRFNESFTGSDVPISLSEIVKNLPHETLNLRQDQTEQEVDPNEFETPFNTQAETISPPISVTRPIIAPVPAPARPRTGAIANYTTRKLNSVGGKFPSPMHAALGTQEPLDAKKVVKLASSLPGVASLTIITADGLSLADNLPTFMHPEGFSAMAPQLHRKLASHASEMRLGELRHLSLSTDAHTVTIFTSDGMTIAVLHQNQSDLGHGVREKFVAIVDGLARQYGPELAIH